MNVYVVANVFDLLLFISSRYKVDVFFHLGNSQSLLIATDVAARGLDIPDVQHVIHYQVPRTTEVISKLVYFIS